MRRALLSLAAGLLVAGAGVPQDLLPPGILLLSRVKQHIKQEVERLPNISCLETVQREVQPPGGKPRPLDTVRLEVLATGNHEFYASPGERKFSEQHPVRYTGSGVIGDGFFGLYLKEVLVAGSVSYEYKGEEDVAGRHLARYDWRLPLMFSGHIFTLQEGSGTVGMHGSFWADPQTYDVIRLEFHADNIPPTLPLTEAVTIINYAATGLGENQVVLLPESGDFRMTRFSGEMDHNRVEFTHCRLFGAQSTISFGAPDAAAEAPARFATSSNDDTLRPLPAGLQIAVKLTTKISSETLVGSLIDGVVAGNTVSKGQVVIANGSRVRGRIRRLERYTDPPPHFVVAIEFTAVESEGIRYRFYADPVEMDPAPGVEQTLEQRDPFRMISHTGEVKTVRTDIHTTTLPGLPGVASFFIRGTKLNLPPGFRTVWRTRTLAP